MNEVARLTLCELVATYGHALCDDPRRCEGLLRDFCGQQRREIFVLVNALREGIAADLLTPPHAMPPAAHRAQLRMRLEEHLGLSAEAAVWAVESWAAALGKSIVEEGAGAVPARPEGQVESDISLSLPSGAFGRSLLWVLSVAALWAAVGGSAGAISARLAGMAALQPNWLLTGALGGALLGMLAGTLALALGGATGELVAWAVSGTVGGTAVGALCGAAAGGLAGAALEGPTGASQRAVQWAALGATCGGVLTTFLGVASWRPGEPEPPEPAAVGADTIGAQTGSATA